MTVSLRPFFALVARHGDGVLAATELAVALDASGEELEAALRAEGIVSAAPIGATFPCGEIGCARVVVADEQGGVFLAACVRDPPACETVTIGKKELARARIALPALLAVVRRELRIEPLLRPRKPKSAQEPLCIGEQGETAPRDVYFARCPREADVTMFLAMREHARRPTLLLVADAALLGDEVLVGHAPGAKVEIDALSEVLEVRRGRVVLARRLRTASTVRAEPEVAEANEEENKAVPRVRRWQDLTLRASKDGRIMAKVGRRARWLSHADLGMVDQKTRKPRRHHAVLLAVCARNGELRWKEFGDFETVKKLMSRLRTAMCAAFGIEEDPFHPFSYERQWRAKFVASAGEEEAPAAVVSAKVEEDDREVSAERAWGAAFAQWEGGGPSRATPRRGGD